MWGSLSIVNTLDLAIHTATGTIELVLYRVNALTELLLLRSQLVASNNPLSL